MRWVKPLIGILLIAVSIGSLLFWEIKGRDVVMRDEIIVAKEDIKEGTSVKPDMFITVGISKENKIEGALTPGDIEQLKGKTTAQLILENSQISNRYFRGDDFYLKQGESIYVVDPSWIAMRSSSLRRGDLVNIYGADGRGIIGTYKVAFVKDSSEREVKDIGEEGLVKSENNILDRIDSTSMIQHIEIISTMNEYQKLVDNVTGVSPTALIIIQKGN